MAEAAHSSIVGGSTADRRINCPGSYGLEQKLPVNTYIDENGEEKVVEESSVYADEGTALHAAMAYILENNVQDLDELIGREFEGFVMTDDLVANALAPCVDFFDALCEELEEEGGFEFAVEKRVEMPGIPGAFGTGDVIGRTNKRSVIIDWKFGVGVLVKAEYEERVYDKETGTDAITKRPNSQPLFYARAGMYSCPEFFGEQPDWSQPHLPGGDRDWPVDVYIAQPRCQVEPTFTSHSTTMAKLEQFRQRLVGAVAVATTGAAPTRRGDWCRFAACKTICPHFTGPALDLTKMYAAIEAKKQTPLQGIDIDWSEAYGELLALADMAEWIIAAIRTQAHSFLESGNTIDGWKLVAKRATEKYVDADGAQAMALEQGLKLKDVLTEPELVSPAQLRGKLAPLMDGTTKVAKEKAAKEKIADFTEKVSSGTTLAHADDKREAVIATSTQLLALSEKLKLLASPTPTE